jgi:hypothetical protein
MEQNDLRENIDLQENIDKVSDIFNVAYSEAGNLLCHHGEIADRLRDHVERFIGSSTEPQSMGMSSSVSYR